MKAITFSQVNLNWAENQDEYNTLPAYVGGNDENDTEKGNISSVHCFELTDRSCQYRSKQENLAQSGYLWWFVTAF